ncbi:MAG: ABC transporter ATP-binding protein/permease [Treponema sp.]|jgi:ATP-binding cassette subfamily B protein|nr:ABC transporter ATP-binding protein/permease [Treponema sp.]
MEDSEQPQNTKPDLSLKNFRFLIPYLYPYRWRYLWGFVCLIAVDSAQILIPQFTARAINLVTAGEGEGVRSRILFLCLGMVAAMAVISTGRFLWRYFIHGASRRIETELRGNLFSHLLSLSYDFYQRSKIGDLMARSTNDINGIREAIGWGLVMLVDGTVMVLGILVVIFIQDAKTAAFALIPLPPITLLILLFGNAVGARFRRAQETYSRMSETVQEAFSGVRVIKSFVKEWWFGKKFAAANDDYRDSNMELVKIYGIFFPLITFLSGLTSLIVILVGGMRVVEGSLSPGALVALFSYFQMLIWPLMGAGFMVNVIQRGASSLGRVKEILDTRPSIESPREFPREFPVHPQRNLQKTGSVFTPSLRQNSAGEEAPLSAPPLLEIRNLTLAYSPEGGRNVLSAVNLRLEEGEMLGILGRTGSGKSSFIKALPRMIDPPPGMVFLKGRDVRDWDLEELRACFALAPQDSFLFSDSIKNNIGYGLDAQGEEADFARAAGFAALNRDLEAFSSGWDTLIGERGLSLSGGQKQRVAIARAFITAPEILILDDALSAVDTETEQRILSALNAEREKCKRQGRALTVIIVSHRVSTLSRADKVAVFENGSLSEYGSPKELQDSGGFFSRTAALQHLGDSAGPAGTAEASPRSERHGSKNG